jgi:putative protease
VHGALCVAYSGQCLTSEAIGGRSANRGACAQACRLPYELVVDGAVRDLGERAYLLSPQDLEASALVPRLVELGVSSIKIEGRLKGPEYVAATTALYRAAVDAAVDAGEGPARALRETALQMYTRGSGPGFLAGVDHQALVEGRGCDHRGTLVGTCQGVSTRKGRGYLRVRAEGEIARGDGVLVEGGRAGEGELGGRVWAIADAGTGAEVERAEAGREVLLWLGPEKRPDDARAGRRVFKTSDPAREQAVRARTEREPHRVALALTVSGAIGERPVFEARSERGGAPVRVEGDTALEAAQSRALSHEVFADKLGRLGDTPFRLGSLESRLPDNAMLPLSSLNRARRALADALLAEGAARSHVLAAQTHAPLLAAARPPDRAPAPRGLFVLCRTLEQATAAVDAGADGVYLDFLELTGTGNAVRALRARGPVHITVAPPRIRKPGEEKIDRYLASLEPDAVLVRGLGALHEGARDAVPRIGDFSLNVTNRLTAAEVLSRNLAAFTPSFDLDAAQLLALLEGPFAPWAELVVHHPMPLFHMEHCVMAALLSSGKDYRDCGRPCEHHKVSLRDRAGMDHPVEADVGCRNTVFHAAAQSAAGLVGAAQRAGVGRFRIELVREGAAEVARIVGAYRALLAGQTSVQEVWRALKADGGYGVVRGSLRVLGAG